MFEIKVLENIPVNWVAVLNMVDEKGYFPDLPKHQSSKETFNCYKDTRTILTWEE